MTRRKPFSQAVRNRLGDVSSALCDVRLEADEQHRRTRSPTLRDDLWVLEQWAERIQKEISEQLDRDDALSGNEVPF